MSRWEAWAWDEGIISAPRDIQERRVWAMYDEKWGEDVVLIGFPQSVLVEGSLFEAFLVIVSKAGQGKEGGDSRSFFLFGFRCSFSIVFVPRTRSLDIILFSMLDLASPYRLGSKEGELDLETSSATASKSPDLEFNCAWTVLADARRFTASSCGLLLFYAFNRSTTSSQ